MASEQQLRSFLQLLLPELLREVQYTAADFGLWPGSHSGTSGPEATQAVGQAGSSRGPSQPAQAQGKENVSGHTQSQLPSQAQTQQTTQQASQQQQQQRKPERKGAKPLSRLPDFLSNAGDRRPATSPQLIGSLVFGVPGLTPDYALGGGAGPSQEALAQGALGMDPRVQPQGTRAARWSVQAGGPALAAGMQLVGAMLACEQGAAWEAS